MNALTFRSTSFEIIDRDGRAWLKAGQIAEALGYSDTSAINRIYARSSDEFTDAMTASVKLTDPNGTLQETRIFSIRGANLIGMKAKTEIAKEFRVWTLDVLEANSRNSFDPAALISATQAGELATLIAQKFPEGKHRPYAWSRFNNHFRVAKYRELPTARFSEAVAYIASMKDKEPAALPAPTEEQLLEIAMKELMRPGRQFILRLRPMEGYENPVPMLMAIPEGAYLVQDEELPKIIAERGQVPRSLLPAIIQAAAGRLA